MLIDEKPLFIIQAIRSPPTSKPKVQTETPFVAPSALEFQLKDNELSLPTDRKRLIARNTGKAILVQLIYLYGLFALLRGNITIIMQQVFVDPVRPSPFAPYRTMMPSICVALLAEVKFKTVQMSP